MTLIPALGRQRQSESKASLVYREDSQGGIQGETKSKYKSKTNKQTNKQTKGLKISLGLGVAAHSCNLSSQEGEQGRGLCLLDWPRIFSLEGQGQEHTAACCAGKCLRQMPNTECQDPCLR